MIRMRSILEIADNTGAKKAAMIGVLGQHGKLWAVVGDVITANVREVTPDSAIKKGEVVHAVVVRTRAPVRRGDGSTIRFDTNAIVLIDNQKNPRGTRIFGPVARELRERNFTKIISLAPEAI
ncbi:MAG: 50S ribosomal protein L14 [Candidatus Omnitrophica bacterium]|nr:50S ribosomal protein L14 [Candidatus Omnitrophota bacterium]